MELVLNQCSRQSRSGQPYLVKDCLVEKVNEKNCKNKHFTLRILSDAFQHPSITVLHDNVKT